MGLDTGHPRRVARLAHPRLPAHLGLSGGHERGRTGHRRPAAGAPPPGDHGDLRPSRRRALRDAAARAAAVIAKAMGFRAEPPPIPEEVDGDPQDYLSDFPKPLEPVAPEDVGAPFWRRSRDGDTGESGEAGEGKPNRCSAIDWL